MPRHFLTGEELTAPELYALLDRAIALKAAPLVSRVLDGKTAALLFEHPSTRTRTSMEAGVFEIGGHPMVLRANELQLTRGESIRDTALVFSRHAAVIGLRTSSEERLRGLAEYAEVPVVNMLSPDHHPLQALADLMTLWETFGSLEGRVLAYVGDGNNVARSLAIVGTLAGMEVRVAAPEGFQLAEPHGAVLTDDAAEAAAGADLLSTPTSGSRWATTSRPPRRAARRSRRTGSTTRCSTAPRPMRSPSTACPRIPARRSPRRSSTGRASASGIRPRTAATRRRPCSSCSLGRVR